ncbi:MAG: ankyrin repeat protein [Granulosicoccus sp.]|jgi:ankyrin repeat protein
MQNDYVLRVLKVNSLFVRHGFLIVTLWIVASPSLMAGARPATEDAACDDVSIKWKSNQSNITEREVNFYLFDASDLGCLTLVTKLLESGASVKAKDRAGNTAFMLSARKGHRQVTELLYKRGSDPHSQNLLGSNALIMAAAHNRYKSVSQLLNIGIDANLSDGKALSPLIVAAYNGNLRIVDLLLEAGADSMTIDVTGKNAMVYASARGYLNIVQRLWESTEKPDPNTRYGNDLTVLMWAAGHGNDVPPPDGIAVAKYLISVGANPRLTDNRGKSAMHIAAERGHHQIVHLLLRTGADSNSPDNNGDTPLALASTQSVRDVLLSADD